MHNIVCEALVNVRGPHEKKLRTRMRISPRRKPFLKLLVSPVSPSQRKQGKSAGPRTVRWFRMSSWTLLLTCQMMEGELGVNKGTHLGSFQSCEGEQSSPPQMSSLNPLIIFNPGILYPVGHKGISLAMLWTVVVRRASLPAVRDFAASEVDLRDKTLRSFGSTERRF